MDSFNELMKTKNADSRKEILNAMNVVLRSGEEILNAMNVVFRSGVAGGEVVWDGEKYVRSTIDSSPMMSSPADQVAGGDTPKGARADEIEREDAVHEKNPIEESVLLSKYKEKTGDRLDLDHLFGEEPDGANPFVVRMHRPQGGGSASSFPFMIRLQRLEQGSDSKFLLQFNDSDRLAYVKSVAELCLNKQSNKEFKRSLDEKKRKLKELMGGD
ncbi:hypothetical protein CCACVL1_14122 [Corchorus capsularis]|uniref:Uncharacterized protein n=1 Tax=Corchorus capsularis TaxID=210143 RepID=A0A1R3I861_COCAP|nr:hypothetical protein CCACVL1_14122 [Corchorus capsularis]